MAKSEIENILDPVNQQVIQLSYRWKIFLQLFDSGKESIELLNKSGANVFELFQYLVIDDAMISLSKLTDPNKSRGNENASISNLINKSKDSLSEKTFGEVEALEKELKVHVRNIRVLRNKILAHSDLEHKKSATTLPSVSYDNIENAIDILQAIVSKIASEACGWTTHYDSIIPYGCGGDTLLEILRLGNESKSRKG